MGLLFEFVLIITSPENKLIQKYNGLDIGMRFVVGFYESKYETYMHSYDKKA